MRNLSPLIVSVILLLNTLSSALADTERARVYPDNLTPVRVQLKWLHQFQFAGFYAAIEQGYFRREGLAVELIEGSPTINPSLEVAQGRAEFGVGNSSLIIDYNNGLPLVAVAAIFQQSPFVIIARRDPALMTVRDLEGHTLMKEAHSEELTAYLRLAGVDLDQVELVDHTGDITDLKQDDPSGIDATSAYLSSEPFDAVEHQVPYRLFSPREIGINFYGDTLFTSKTLAETDPHTVDAMRRALIDGWLYAQTHQDELVNLIHRAYQPSRDPNWLALEATVTLNLLNSDIVEPGYMNPQRWRHIADKFVAAGLLAADYRLEGFLFEPDHPVPKWLYQALAAGILLITVVILVAIYIANLNSRLKYSIRCLNQRTRELESANRKLYQLSTKDKLTGLANRRSFDMLIDAETARAQRSSQPLSLLLIDVDHFKGYNDQHGHQKGDQCLAAIAAVLKDSARRAGDLAARYGGEEFVIVAPNLNATQAQHLADGICQQVAALSRVHPASPHQVVTVSIGISYSAPGAPLNSHALIGQADQALYRAKSAGRNRSVLYQDSGQTDPEQTARKDSPA
ncbi:MAG: hypothetical protein CMI01_04560 [Oceanospirillaceae bacterium]|nr:hypothetical protein [Oceanospirillaceae bacterium]